MEELKTLFDSIQDALARKTVEVQKLESQLKQFKQF